MEPINTRGQFDTSLPDGEREFRIEEIRRVEKGVNVFYIWRLSFDGSGEREEGEQLLLPSMMGDLLRVLGCEETGPKKFNWDRDLLPGKHFIATVSHSPDKKKPEVIRQYMDGFKKSGKADEDLPF
jgi:hypothetical protein